MNFILYKYTCTTTTNNKQQQQQQQQQGNRRYQPAVCNTLNSIYFLNLSPINAKLTSLSYIHASKYICFSTNVHHYHSNNSYGDVQVSNSSHKSSISPFLFYFRLQVISK